MNLVLIIISNLHCRYTGPVNESGFNHNIRSSLQVYGGPTGGSDFNRTVLPTC